MDYAKRELSLTVDSVAVNGDDGSAAVGLGDSMLLRLAP
jgi:hypothetical protein